MPWLYTFMPSAAIANLEVYVMSLHRLPALVESFVVQMLGKVSSLLGLACLTPNASLVSILYSL